MPPETQRPRVLSGIQPTGSGSHLGNWLGAIRQWVTLQDTADSFFFIPDMHAITVAHDPDQLRRRTREAVAELLACGLDPDRCTLFVQSQVHEHAELAWVLGGLTGYGEAQRMTQFKDKAARSELGGATVGLLVYPVLQAADILLYQTDEVPVGEDQRQHVELTRDLAQRFNHRFGEAFTVPRAVVPRLAARVADLQDPTRKMSKSLGAAGTIYLNDPPAQIAKKVKSAVTDTGREVRADPDKPGITNLLGILATLTDRTVADVEQAYEGHMYGAFKADVADALVAVLEPIQARFREITADPTIVDRALVEGAHKASAVAGATMTVVRERVGFLPAVQG